MEGRLTLAPGSVRASEYLATEFKKIGLKPYSGSSFFSEFEVTVNQRPTRNNLLVLEHGGRRWPLELGKDFVPLPGSAPTRLVSGEVVFVGYGLRSTTRDDFAGKNLQGKIALILRGAPEGERPTSNGARARAASEQGASAVLFVGPSGPGRAELPRLTRGQGVPAGLGIVAAAIHRDALKRVLGTDLAGAPSAGAAPVEGLSARIVTELEPNRGTARNVVGMLPGRDPNLASEMIVVGAHYDHLGFGEVGSLSGTDQIHFGADDNGSGTSAVLALARWFAQAKVNRRTMVFQLYSGEEVGLVGSAAWASAHSEDLKRVSLMVNLDMVGRLRDGRVDVSGIGTAAELADIVKQVSVPGLTIRASAGSPGNSDHASFQRRGVPVLFWFTGMHPEYHTEKDRFETVNTAGIALVAEGVRDAILQVDRLDRKLEFKGAVGRPGAPTGDPGRSRRARVGFIPDMGDSGPGLLLNGASPDSPASKAGILAGDRLIEFDGKRIDGIDDLQAALVEARPNVTVRIAILRNGQRIELELTPAEAPSG